MQADVVGLIANKGFPPAPNDHDGMHVGMPLQRRAAARGHFEVTKLCGRVLHVEEDLPRHVLEWRGAFLLVLEDVDAFPAEGAVGMADDLHADILSRPIY